MNEPTHTPEEADLISRLVKRALTSAGSVEPQERADLYHAASIILAPIDPQLAEVAGATAGHLRAAEQAQLKFASLL